MINQNQFKNKYPVKHFAIIIDKVSIYFLNFKKLLVPIELDAVFYFLITAYLIPFLKFLFVNLFLKKMLRINILSIQYILDIPGTKEKSYYGSDRFRVNVVLSMYFLITCTVIFKKNRSPFFELFFFKIIHCTTCRSMLI